MICHKGIAGCAIHRLLKYPFAQCIHTHIQLRAFLCTVFQFLSHLGGCML